MAAVQTDTVSLVEQEHSATYAPQASASWMLVQKNSRPYTVQLVQYRAVSHHLCPI